MWKFLLLLLFGNLALSSPDWKDYSNSEAHFSTVFPAQPQLSVTQTDSPIGAVTTQIFSCKAITGNFSVAYTELPEIAVSFASNTVYENARKGILQDAQADETSWTPLKHGYELAYHNSKQQGWSQILILGNNLYVLDARVDLSLAREQVKPFFEKFIAQ